MLRSDGDARALNPARQNSLDNPAASGSPDGEMITTACDRAACFADNLRAANGLLQGISVGVVKHPSAFAEECANRNIIVSALKAPMTCTRPLQIIDRDVLSRGGAIFVTLQADQKDDQGMVSGAPSGRVFRVTGKEAPLDIRTALPGRRSPLDHSTVMNASSSARAMPQPNGLPKPTGIWLQFETASMA